MFVTAKNKVKKTFVEQNQAKFFSSFHFKAKNSKRKQAKKLVLDFRLSKRKQSETDPVSLISEKNF
jgi:hypothetical protein